MAKEYTPVSLEDIKRYLKRAFHSMPYRERVARGQEIVLDMKLSYFVGIRVMTSVHGGSSQAAGVGQDAIRVMLWNIHKDRPLKAKAFGGKALPVQRTKGWKDTLRRKVEALVEEYYEKDDYWDHLAGRPDRPRE